MVSLFFWSDNFDQIRPSLVLRTFEWCYFQCLIFCPTSYFGSCSFWTCYFVPAAHLVSCYFVHLLNCPCYFGICYFWSCSIVRTPDFSSLAFKKCTYFDIRLNWVEHLLLMVNFWAFYIFFCFFFLLHISIILLSFTLIYNCLFKSMQFGHFLPLFLVSSKLESYIEFLVTNTKQEAELQNVSGICEA